MVWGCLLLLHQLVNNEQYSIIQLTGVTRMNIKLAIILLVKTLYKLRYRVVPMKSFSFKDKNFQNMVHDTYFARYSSDTCHSPQGILIWQYSTSGGSSRPSLYKLSTPPITSSKHTTAWHIHQVPRYVLYCIRGTFILRTVSTSFSLVGDEGCSRMVGQKFTSNRR